MYHAMGKFSRRQSDDIFFYFSQKTGLKIACKLSAVEIICMKCQILLSGENKKYFKITSAEMFALHGKC